jgi:hypothetical protein
MIAVKASLMMSMERVVREEFFQMIISIAPRNQQVNQERRANLQAIPNKQL